jgi:hypothetical protein
VQSAYLSSSRIEVGFPPIGTCDSFGNPAEMVKKSEFHPHGISNNENDGFLTSGSWTVEMTVKYVPQLRHLLTSVTQSLCRVCVTGSLELAYFNGLEATPLVVANMIAISSSTEPRLILYCKPGLTDPLPYEGMALTLPMLTGTNLFNGDRWNVSFGCERNDSIGSIASSSYFVRLASQDQGEITHFSATSSFLLESATGFDTDDNILRTKYWFLSSEPVNEFGAFLCVGTNQTILSGTGYYDYFCLNHYSDPGYFSIPAESLATNFEGRMSNLRFWSKALTETEWKEHVRNYKSTGVHDPLVNWNYEHARSGSWERLRMDTMGKQTVRRANATASLGELGTITFLDFSQNGFHLTGSGFPIDDDCVKAEIIDYSFLSPYFDEASTNEKIRIRSYQDQTLLDNTPWAQSAPVYEVVKSEQPTDDTRFSIDFSLIDALNRDIVTIFATFDAIDNALGNPELVYSPDYPDLDRLRNIYFNRIQEKLNFQAFFRFFRWFDTSIGTFISQLVPRKTNFKGTNFVIESHMLERHKLEYLSSDIYLGEEDRSRIKDVLLLQLFAASCRKY